MKTLILCLILTTAAAFSATAQSDKAQRESPPDKVSATIGKAIVSIDYSRPSVKGRKIWGDLVPFGQVWRTGANEATTFQTDKDVTIEGKKLRAGKYALFTIPNKNDWTIIFNKVADQWGAYKYEAKQDALRVKVKPKKTTSPVEQLTFKIDEKGVSLFWELIQVDFKVK